MFMLPDVAVHSYDWNLIRSWNQARVKRVPMLVAVLSGESNHGRLHSTEHKPTYESN